VSLTTNLCTFAIRAAISASTGTADGSFCTWGQKAWNMPKVTRPKSIMPAERNSSTLWSLNTEPIGKRLRSPPGPAQ
jgi:hypothetical protein